MSGWTRDLQRFRAFVGRLPSSSFVALVEVSLITVILGLYLFFHQATNQFRARPLLLLFALVHVVFGFSLIFLRSFRGGEEERPRSHSALSVGLIAVAVIFNLWAIWIVWGL